MTLEERDALIRKMRAEGHNLERIARAARTRRETVRAVLGEVIIPRQTTAWDIDASKYELAMHFHSKAVAGARQALADMEGDQ